MTLVDLICDTDVWDENGRKSRCPNPADWLCSYGEDKTRCIVHAEEHSKTHGHPQQKIQEAIAEKVKHRVQKTLTEGLF